MTDYFSLWKELRVKASKFKLFFNIAGQKLIYTVIKIHLEYPMLVTIRLIFFQPEEKPGITMIRAIIITRRIISKT